jgi:hypothetical protein
MGKVKQGGARNQFFLRQNVVNIIITRSVHCKNRIA